MSKLHLLPVLGLVGLMLGGCANPVVTSGEAIAIAESYRVHLWEPTAKNRFVGFDPDGVWVETPDVSRSPYGWWMENVVNAGVPYKWGGFDSLRQFDKKIREGYAAGDLYTLEKRSLLHAAVSRHAAGVDCSGYISRCLKMRRHYSTRELPALCEPVDGLLALKPGDLLNKQNDHVMLFARYEKHRDGKLRAMVYQAGSAGEARVTKNAPTIEFLTTNGYVPMRYRRMRD
jgi:hypothetical protein